MPWTTAQDGHAMPDGTPFPDPADSFEQAYNHRLATDPTFAAEARDPAAVAFDPADGWPVSMRSFLARPGNLRGTMSQFFDPGYQAACQEAGNTPGELDTLAKRLLAFAVIAGIPVTDRERAIARRLGVRMADNLRAVEGPGGQGY